MSTIHHAAVIGGGPAGLQAALTLGRMHVATLLFDDALYRNATSARMQNVLGWDGATPAELRSAGRAELAAYPWVSVIEERVTAASADEAGLTLVTSTSEWIVERVLVASGVHDALLPIPGLKELWGDLVLPCPYCHGHEFSSDPIAVISSGGHAEHVSGLLRGISGSVPVLAPEDVTAVTRSQLGVTISLRDGTAVEAACVFIPPNSTPRSSVAADLGVLAGPEGIDVDALGRTGRPGVWAAGDVAKRVDPRIPAAVITAMASGLIAAADIAASVATARDARSA
jgi:thioredoxin reductase